MPTNSCIWYLIFNEVMKAKVNAFGLYTLIALLWDTITFAYVSVIVRE